MRYGPLSRRKVLRTALMALLALGIPAVTMAQGKGKGGKGGGGDDGGDSSAPPVTYMISYIDGFRGWSNESGDMAGEALVAGLWKRAISYNGSIYLLDDLFAGTGATPRAFYDISERTSNAGLYLCGGCDTPNGIRGFRLLVEPDANEILKPIEIDYPAPSEGDDQTLLNNVNSSGQAVGQSRLSTTNERQAIYFAPDGTVTAFFDEGSPQGLTESGICVFLNRSDGDNPYPAYTWSPGGLATPILADVQWVSDVNELADFVGQQRTLEGSGKKAKIVDSNFILTDDLYQESADRLRTFEGLNNYSDVLVRDVILGNGQNPDRVVGSIIFGDTGEEFTIDEMIDPANSDAAVLRYLDSSIEFGDIKNTGVIYGIVKPLGSGEQNATVILTPILSP